MDAVTSFSGNAAALWVGLHMFLLLVLPLLVVRQRSLTTRKYIYWQLQIH